MKTRVAQYQADRTNQKLYFTRIYCQLAEQEDSIQLQDAHIESAVVHLYGSYLAFLQEMSRFYNLSLAEPTLLNIEQQLASKGQVSPEVLQLKQRLENDFLGEIEHAWHNVLYKTISQKTESNIDKQDRQNRLAIVDVTAAPFKQEISISKVREWRVSMLELIESLRKGMLEY